MNQISYTIKHEEKECMLIISISVDHPGWTYFYVRGLLPHEILFYGWVDRSGCVKPKSKLYGLGENHDRVIGRCQSYLKLMAFQ